MQLRSLQGDDAINNYLTAAMEETIATLERRGIITTEQADKFLSESACILLPADSPLKAWVKRLFGPNPDQLKCGVVIASIDIEPENTNG